MPTSEPDHTQHEDDAPQILDPVRATEPTSEDEEPTLLERLVTGPGAVSGGPAGPANQSGGTPAP